MKQLLRPICFLGECFVYGVPYGLIQYFVRAPQPLDAEAVWRFITRPGSAPVEWLCNAWPPKFVRHLLLKWWMRRDFQAGVEYHYDISNAFFELFLDKKFMFYTCADFASPQDTLEEAQTRKADYLLNLIQPRPGEKILDLGCGWGGMMRRIIEVTGEPENIVGYTLSKAQLAYVQERYPELRVELKNFITCDYPAGHFDKIYSIGAWDSVRGHDIDMLLKKHHDALKAGGRIVHHFLTMPENSAPTAMVACQIFFPGYLPPPHPAHVRAFEKAGFRIVHRSIHEYRPTVRAWFDRLVANRERALELVGTRTFNQFIAYFASAWKLFTDGQALVFRYVLEKVGAREEW